MWLITPIGFFSIVCKPDDKHAGTLTVRARLQADLVALKELYLPGLGRIRESSDSDYRFRATAPRAEVSAAMARMVDALDYGNFKSEVAKRQGSTRAHLYHDVWSVLYKLQTDTAFAAKEPSAGSYGGVVVSGGNRVLLREPAKHHGGYAWTFAKTEAKIGESPQDAALRAVREKTGYEATVLATVPGMFKGSASSTRYFVMDARHPPAPAGWQTVSLRWVRFEEARVLVRQSHDAGRRERNLAVLDAAEAAASTIPYKAHARTQPEDWNNLQEMPERHTVLHPQLRYTATEMADIQRGFFPTDMDQRWFLFFTGNRLRMHRSWTGMLIYDVDFAFDATGGARVTQVIVNRDAAQYGNTDDEHDLKSIGDMIRVHLLERPEEPPMDGFLQGVTLAAQPNYLGSPEVVSGLVQTLFEIAVRAAKGEATGEEVQACAAAVVAAFTDDGAGYTRMPGWHSAEQMGVCVRRYLGGNTEGDGEQTLATILGAGLAAVFEKICEIMLGFFRDPEAKWQDHALVQLNALHAYVDAVLLGTNTLTHADKTLDAFHWLPLSAAHAGDEQLILDVGAEGGSVRLLGSCSSEVWAFRVETRESALIDKDETPRAPEKPWVTTWRGALKQLDAYPWPQLYPLTVHDEFRERVLSALRTREKKGIAVEWDTWRRALGIDMGK